MNDRSDWTSRDRNRDDERLSRDSSERGSGHDYPGEFARDNWDRTGSVGSARPRDDSWPSRGQSQSGDRRTHDWEVGDRHYTGQSPSGPGYGGQNYGGQAYGSQGYYGNQGSARSRNLDRGYGPTGADLFTSEDYGGGARAWSGTGASGGAAGTVSSYGAYTGAGSYGRDDGRGFADRAVDEVRSWFGDKDAERRREEDHRGRGPSDYTRSDERIREDANDRLTEDPRLDARQISVTVTEGEVTLAGTVEDRSAKRRAEDCVDAISGVKHVQNNLRVKPGSSLEGQGGTLGWGGGDKSVTPDA
ncbi:osmotically-inducible protein OsmY [Novosphingobium hassiacum]|uniref:Osmotically-inducible protein OsmY n=1 Tax=Novosphingobium hassiacum TaxID=173676 RepID=A0A7W5ZVB2_9SPHN|nr:BON domain-containing protein [Novosphingobium hassiacum]MBB3859753.1 osmotically-inducible protein OsmY [Novosphingobium hassiacum]